jgi:hypothetical protein
VNIIVGIARVHYAPNSLQYVVLNCYGFSMIFNSDTHWNYLSPMIYYKPAAFVFCNMFMQLVLWAFISTPTVYWSISEFYIILHSSLVFTQYINIISIFKVPILNHGHILILRKVRWACGRWGMHTKFWSGILKGGNYLEDNKFNHEIHSSKVLWKLIRPRKKLGCNCWHCHFYQLNAQMHM